MEWWGVVKMKEIILVIMLLGIVVLGGVQAIQINDLKEDVKENMITGSTINNVANTAPVRTKPSMVGGC